MERWILFVSPYESISNKWEVLTFESEDSLDNYVLQHDLTKEYYATTIVEMVNIIRESGKWI